MIGFAIIIFIIWVFVRHNRAMARRCDEPNEIVGEATEYGPCSHCHRRNCQVAKGRGEVITRGGHYVVRQYHICLNCDARALWHRRLDQFCWTMNRSGVHAPR